MRAIFGPPIERPIPGGLSITTDLITVYEGRFVTFQWPTLDRAGHHEGRPWFPWDYLQYGEAAGHAASRVLAQWTGRTDLGEDARACDLYSAVHVDGTWRHSMIFRVELTEVPEPTGHITAVDVIAPDDLPEHICWFPRGRLLTYLAA